MKHVMFPLQEKIDHGNRPVRENKIEAHLVKRVEEHGGKAYKFKSPQHANVPDRIVTMPHGYLCFVELKATGEKPSKAQLREHDRLRKLGQVVLVFNSMAAIEGWIADDVIPLILRGSLT